MTEIETLARELARVRDTLNYFMDPLTHGLYPQRNHANYSPATQFRGSAQDQLFQIFKIIDYEIRRLASAALKAGIDLNEVHLDYPSIFDEVSRATGITETAHSD
jgi:hypothetical protein